MIWNKKKTSTVVIYTIVAAVFILLSLILPFNKPAASWVMFAFSIASIVAGAFISIYAFGKKEELVSKYYGYPLFRIGFLYTTVQVAATILVYIVGAFTDVPYWIGVLLSVLLLGTAAIGCIVVDNVRDFIEEVEIQEYDSIKTVTLFQNDISDILNLCKSEEVREPLSKLVTKFKYSDPVSSEATKSKEDEIHAELDCLRERIALDDTGKIMAQIEIVANLLNSRNRICETSK